MPSGTAYMLRGPVTVTVKVTVLKSSAADVPCGAPDAFWSGFYASRPNQKALSRQLDARLAATEALAALGTSDHSGRGDPTLDIARETAALMTHHDAITGTSFTECTFYPNDCEP
eukprot:708023-Prorocentrum_minimum.AAC.1